MAYRPCDIAISSRTFWILQRVAAAQRARQTNMDMPITADAVAEELLRSALEAKFPTLAEMFRQREQVNDEAETLIAKNL